MWLHHHEPGKGIAYWVGEYIITAVIEMKEWKLRGLLFCLLWLLNTSLCPVMVYRVLPGQKVKNPSEVVRWTFIFVYDSEIKS